MLPRRAPARHRSPRSRDDAGDERPAHPHRCPDRPDHDERARGRDHDRARVREDRRPGRARARPLVPAPKPVPIVPRELIRGVTERIDRDGDVLVSLDEAGVVEAIDSLLAEGVSAIAVCLLWSFVNDAHEQRIGELLAERTSGIYLSLSYEVAPRMGEYERTVTTAVNAYVGPRVARIPRSRSRRCFSTKACAVPCWSCRRAAGLTSTQDAARRPIVTLDSGPTGGILGCQHLASLDEERNVICTDVGGTSFDVGLVLDGEVPLDPEPVVGQYSLRFPEGARAVDRLGGRQHRLARRQRASPGRPAERGLPARVPSATASVEPTRRSLTPTSSSGTSAPVPFSGAA